MDSTESLRGWTCVSNAAPSLPPSLPLSPLFIPEKKKNYSPSLIPTNSLSLPLLFFHFLSLPAPPFPLLALPPTHAYIGMEMRQSSTLAANIQIQSVRPHKKKKKKKKRSPASCQPLKLLKQIFIADIVNLWFLFIFFTSSVLQRHAKKNKKLGIDQSRLHSTFFHRFERFGSWFPFFLHFFRWSRCRLMHVVVDIKGR